MTNKVPNALQERLAAHPIALEEFVRATRRVVARLGGDVVLDEAGSDEIGLELYAMSLEEPEWEVFS